MKSLISIICIAILVLNSCSSDNDLTSNERRDVELNANTRAVSLDLQDFYFKFTKDVLEHETLTGQNGNIVISPLSAAMNLAMISNGTDETSASNILKYLGVSNINSLNEFSSSMISFLPNADRLSEVSLANAIWVNSLYKLNNEVNSLMQDKYRCSIQYLDFSSSWDRAKNEINSWCANHTANQILSFPGSERALESRSILICLNALCFDGKWAREYFPKANTVKEIFHGEHGDSHIDFMKSAHRTMFYHEDANFQMVKLSFGNQSFYIELWLPSQSLSLTESYKFLTTETWDYLNLTSTLCDVAIELPKFKTAYKIDLGEVFLNSEDFDYDGSVNLTMFDTEREAILNYDQTCVFEIDENGAKAASVTSSSLLDTEPIPGKKYTLRFDRPFYFFIREQSTGACLLSGRIANI